MKGVFQITLLTLFLLQLQYCSHDNDYSCECFDDLDCPPGYFCYEETCACYAKSCFEDEDCPQGTCCDGYQCSEYACGVDCERDDECADIGPCMECINHLCTSYACYSDADCPDIGDGPRYCGEFDDLLGCMQCEYLRCEVDNRCDDPTFPLYVECEVEQKTRCIHGQCMCRPPCGASCPDGQYCCRVTQTCDPIPEPCWVVECPPGEQVNPDPGGTLNEDTCQVEGADCSCVVGP